MKQAKSGLSPLATHALAAALVTVVINVVFSYILLGLLWSSDSDELSTQMVQGITGYLAFLCLEGLLLIPIFHGGGIRRPVKLAAASTLALLVASLLAGLLLPAYLLYIAAFVGVMFAFYYRVFEKTDWGPKTAKLK